MERRSYWKLTEKEKQMVNKIMREIEGNFSAFNVTYIVVFLMLMLMCGTQRQFIFMFALVPIMFITIRLKMYYFYKTHPEINFDKDREKYQKESDYVDIMKKLSIGFVCVAAVIGIGLFISINGNSSDGGSSDNGNGYHTKCTTRPDGKRCCTSCKKTSYGDVGCYTTCN